MRAVALLAVQQAAEGGAARGGVLLQVRHRVAELVEPPLQTRGRVSLSMGTMGRG